MIELSVNPECEGSVQVAEDVVAIIAGTAAMEVDGVVAADGNFTGNIAEILGKKNLSKGVRLTVNENSVSVELNIQVRFGFKVKDVSEEVQKRVKTAIETMIGLSAPEVNVNVTGIYFDRENKKASEAEA